MAGLNLNIGTSVLKREAKPIEEVDKRLTSAGWKRTASVANGRLRYYSLAGINITALGGPLGTVIMPSGPIRGAAFGDNALNFSTTSAIGAGAKVKKEEQPGPNPDQMV